DHPRAQQPTNAAKKLSRRHDIPRERRVANLHERPPGTCQEKPDSGVGEIFGGWSFLSKNTVTMLRLGPLTPYFTPYTCRTRRAAATRSIRAGKKRAAKTSNLPRAVRVRSSFPFSIAFNVCSATCSDVMPRM